VINIPRNFFIDFAIDAFKNSSKIPRDDPAGEENKEVLRISSAQSDTPPGSQEHDTETGTYTSY
jgi:hypothetical protein